MSAKKQVVVIGAGIVGASIAWHLNREGAEVTVLAGGAAGGIATPASFAWINASWGNPEFYFRLRARAMEEWERLADVVDGLPYRRCGGLCFDLPPADLATYCEQHASWGYDIRQVDLKEAGRIEPGLVAPPAMALYAAGEAAVEASEAALHLLRNARLRVHDELSAERLELMNGRVVGVVTGAGTLSADEVVLAAGAATPELAATVGIEVALQTPPGLIVHSAPFARLVHGIVLSERAHFRQTISGRIIAGTDFSGDDPGERREEAAANLFALVKAMLRGSDGLQLDFHTMGYRPTPRDGYPVIGRPASISGLTFAVMHSGVTLAPGVGRLLASEIMHGERDPLLAPFSPDRDY